MKTIAFIANAICCTQCGRGDAFTADRKLCLRCAIRHAAGINARPQRLERRSRMRFPIDPDPWHENATRAREGE